MLKVSLLLLLISGPASALSFKDSFIKAATAKDVWIPSVSALAFGISKYDGRISDYASRERPLFGSAQNAKDYSDRIAFYYFPVASTLSTVIGTNERAMSSRQQRYLSYLNILSGPALTYLFNNFLKNRSGRLRPDASNRESFPSSHTAIASAFSENASIYSPTFAGNYSTTVNIVNESLGGVVGWARMESKKHHLSDVLVGYSIGKFFTKFFHYWLIEKNSTAKVGITIEPSQSFQGTYSWNF
jgi:hypothetical protein